MRIRVLIIICILWIAGVFIYFNTTAEGQAEQYNYDNDCVPMSDGRYIVTGSDKLSQYMFDIDKYYRINNIYCVSDFCEDGVLDQIEYLKGYIYLMIRADAQVGAKSVPIYNLIKLDENMTRIGSSGWFDFSQKGEISDLTLSDGVFAITQLSEDGMSVYIYPLEEERLTIDSDTDENNVRHVRTLNYTDYFESEADGVIYFASFEDGVLNKYENYSEDIPEEYFNTYAADAYNNKVLNYRQLLFINFNLFINCMAVMVMGIATILALYVMLVRRNRIAYLILVWEIMALGNSVVYVWMNGRSMVNFALAAIVFVISSVIGIAILLLQSSDLLIFMNAMKKVSQGRNDIYKPKMISGDMHALWNSLFDLMLFIKNTKYNMFQEYERYYTFAPKHMESVLERQSLVDVAIGDMAKVHTTVGIIANSGDYSKEEYNSIFASIATLQEAGDGNLLSINPDATLLEVLFDKDNKTTLDFALSLYNILSAKNTCMLMHNSELIYEICGDNRQNAAIVHNKEVKELAYGVSKLSELGLNLVMTEEAYLNEKERPLARNIGHFCLSNVNKNIELYEILDCLPEKERRNKVENMDNFNQAMEHIKKMDYYFARNMFAKIILSDPNDEVARHYLFKCEQCLSMDNDVEVDFGLNR